MKAGIVLSAGKGTRFKSKKQKIFHEILGKQIYKYAKDEIKDLVDEIFIVSSNEIENENCIIQEKQLGTGHALLTAHHKIPKEYTQFLIVSGDSPCITKNTLSKIIDFDFGICVFDVLDIEKPYGRFIENKIVEFRDATTYERSIKCCYSGVMHIKRDIINHLEKDLLNRNTHECYITDLVGLYSDKIGVVYGKEEEFLGINTREELSDCTKILNYRFIKNHMENGVTFTNPNSCIVYNDTEIGMDTVINESVHIGKNVKIGENVVIKPFTVLEDCYIHDNAVIGPFAHIRGGTNIHEGCEIGNFVEIKKSEILTKSKAKHLSYIGDSFIGNNVNIGAGAITCNYDGKNKHKTIIGDKTFIGSNSCMIAPITIGKECIVGAGSVVSKDIDDNTLVIRRPKEEFRKKIK